MHIYEMKGRYNLQPCTAKYPRVGFAAGYVGEPIDWSHRRIFDSVGEGDPPGRRPTDEDLAAIEIHQNLAFRERKGRPSRAKAAVAL